jgi:hypothetical protein
MGTSLRLCTELLADHRCLYQIENRPSLVLMKISRFLV